MDNAGLATHHPQFSGVAALPIIHSFDLCTPTCLFWILLTSYDTQDVPRLRLLSHQYPDLPQDCGTHVIHAHSEGEQLLEVQGRGRKNGWKLEDKKPKRRGGGKNKFCHRNIPAQRWWVSGRTRGWRVVRSRYTPPPPGRRSKLTGVYMSHKLLPVMMMPPYSLNHFSTLPDKEERHVRYFAWHNYQRFFIEEDLT